VFASKCLSIRRVMGAGLTSHRTVAWGSDPCGIESWPDDFGIDAATIAAFDGDRQLGPSGLVQSLLSANISIDQWYKKRTAYGRL
jgi:hypothetical protein